MNTIKTNFINLYKDNKTYTILQLGYAIIAVASLVICGLIALINQNLGITLLYVPCAATAILGINALFWSILKTILDSISSKK